MHLELSEMALTAVLSFSLFGGKQQLFLLFSTEKEEGEINLDFCTISYSLGISHYAISYTARI